MARPRTKEGAIAWCGRMLGDGVVVVELTPAQIEDAWDDAIEWFIGNRGISRQAIASYSGPGVYTVPDDVDTVLEVYFPRNEYPSGWDYPSMTMVGVDQAVAYYGRDSDFSNYYSTMVLWMQRAETARRLTSQDPRWEWRPELQAIHVFPSNKTFSGSVVAEYISNVVRDEDPKKSSDLPNDLRRMSSTELKFILDYFLAGAKIRLGRVRSKYSDGLPASGGKTMLDGDILISEAKETMEKLDEELPNYGSTPILTG